MRPKYFFVQLIFIALLSMLGGFIITLAADVYFDSLPAFSLVVIMTKL